MRMDGENYWWKLCIYLTNSKCLRWVLTNTDSWDLVLSTYTIFEGYELICDEKTSSSGISHSGISITSYISNPLSPSLLNRVII